MHLCPHLFLFREAVFFLALIFTHLCHGESNSPIVLVSGPFPSSINIKDYGAKGDGETDDTKAIQAAANAAGHLEKISRVRLGNWRGLAGGTSQSTYPEIYFPEGSYKISETIVFPRSAFLRGSGKSVIIQINPNKDVFYFHSSYRYAIENIIFEGGKTQLKFWTGNNWARLVIRNCVFRNSSNYAVECLSFTEKKLTNGEWNKSKPWPPYIINTDAIMPVLPNTAETLTPWYNSTLLTVDSSHFDQCHGALNAATDTTVFSNSSLIFNPQSEIAQLKVGGQTSVYNLQGIAKSNPKLDQFWIETDGNLSLQNVDLGTEGDNGIGFIRSSIVSGPTHRGLRLDNCRVKVAGSKDNALVVVQEGTMPSLISINNVEETSGRKVQAIRWKGDKLLDLLQIKHIPFNRSYMIVFGTLSNNIDPILPMEIQQLKKDPIPNKIIQIATVEAVTQKNTDPDQPYIIIAEDYGIVRDPAKDQTKPLQKLFDLAGEFKNPLIIFPGATSFLVSETLSLPQNIRVRVAGVSSFKQINPDKDIFHADNSERLKIENCDFIGGKNAVSITTKPESKSFVAFDYCSFFDQREAGIISLSMQEGVEIPNHTDIHAKNIIFRTGRGLITNARRTLISAFWAINDPHLNNAAFFENRGGEMRIQNMLGNPVLWSGHANKKPSTIKDWVYSKNVRWFDNWGRLHTQNVRFGGESGGMCNVVNYSANGTVFIDGGISRFHNDASVKAILFSQEKPRLSVLRNISVPPTKPKEKIQTSDGIPIQPDNQTVFISGLLAP